MRIQLIHSFGSVLLGAMAVVAVGCGDSAHSSVAPTGTTLASQGAVLDSHGGGGNSGSGSNSGPGNSNGGSNSGGSNTGGSNTGGNNSGPGKGNDTRLAEINGAIQAVSGKCPALQMTIAGRSVSTTASTEFKDTTCAKLAVGQMAEVKGTLQPDGSVVATRIEGQDRDNEDNDEGEVSGPITASTGTCPALTLTVGTTIVKTSTATLFHDGACSALRVGTIVEAKGARQSDGSLLASRLEPEEMQ
jgi:hypothetical protein